MTKIMCAAFCAVVVLSSCSRKEELSLEEIEGLNTAGTSELLAKTVKKPWKGEAFAPGIAGGTLYATITGDPKSFNLLVGERDEETYLILEKMHDDLVDYDYVRHEFVPSLASFEINADEAAGTLSVVYTLRDDLYWSFYNSERKVKVTSDDVIFWYDEIQGDPEFQSSLYNAQFVTMKDGTEAHINIRKIDDRRFAFDFPRIISNPVLSTNMMFGPRFLYEKAKTTAGVQGVLDLFSVAVDPKTIPSVGMWFLVEYTPGQRMVYKANPDYWKKDSAGGSIPYMTERIVQIVPDQNTQLLIFKQGKQDSCALRPEDLDEVINKENADYTVFSAEGSLRPFLWSFNQNPAGKNTPQYEWFIQKEFRQAMSCLLNRDRIIAQTYRGLAEPKLDFFPEPNPFYNPDIKLKYLYDQKKALSLFAKIGMKRDGEGILRDSQGRAVEFDLTVPADINVLQDISSIMVDECAKVGIKVQVRATDFQKMVEQMTNTYDWQSMIIGLGDNYWPTGGSNVWPTTGNLHLWNPLQEKPATEWEARIDYLYNEGSYTIDNAKAKKIWDEYQRLILEECPVIYLVRPQRFLALRNRWNFTNVYFDNIGDLTYEQMWLKQ